MEISSIGVFVALCAILTGAWGWVLAEQERAGRRRIQNEYRRANRRLSRVTQMLELAQDTAPLGFWEYDPATGAQVWSAGLNRLFGLEDFEELCPGDAEMLLASGVDELRHAISANRDNTGIYSLELNIMRVDGAQRVFRMNARNMRSRDGTINRIVAAVRDVSDVRAREKALRETERRADEARKQAETDPLTGLANRRRVMDFLDKAILKCSQGGKPIALVMLDIDHFKAINDRYGHQVGDEVLKRVANIACQHARKDDLVGRMGGEEFVVCMEGAAHSTVLTIAERLRHAIGKNSAIGNVTGVTVSLGYAVWQAGDTSLTLFARADEALYAAKEGGRNQVRKAA
ncbi:diguanylate cyclase [Altererythrobacter sp. MF3-039]|uniref:GGDEF domain-containing protein n=1 Tax=Altererythrobacter sp. MF3-039 TaxID=3252901 RepID=UPI00390C51A5